MNIVVWLMRSAILYLILFLPAFDLCHAATHTVTVGDDSCNHGLSFVDSTGVCSNQSTIALGDTINWVWGDNVMSHSTTSGTCIGAVCQTTPFWNSGEFTNAPPHSFSRVFNNPGVFPYFCTVHDSQMTGTVRVLPAPATLTPQPSIPVGLGPFTVVTGDFNKDGKLDLAVANRDNNTVTILLGVGNGTFTVAPGSPISDPSFNGPASIAVADFNKDGKLDLAVANSLDKSGTASVTILLGNGDGTFTVKGPVPVFSTYPQALIAADFDGDGKMDLAVAIAPLTVPVTTNNVKVLLGNGDGTFGSLLSLSTNALTPDSLTAFDFNHDGKPDLAVVNSGGGSQGNRISIFLNNSSPGALSFANAVNYNAGPTPHGIVAGMFANAQGVPTPGIAVPNAATNTVGVYLADNAGNFTPVSGSPFTVGSTGSPVPIAVAAADFNGDGFLDLAVVNNGGGTNSESSVTTLMSDAAGSFNSFTTTASEAFSNPREIAIGDFNGDGKPDLALANFSTNDISILLNGTPFPPAPPQPATHFGITVQSAGPPTPEGNPSTTAGVAFQITVTAYDAYQRVATGYIGTVHFDSSDPQSLPSAGLPADYTFTGSGMDNGVHVFTVTLKTADPAPQVQTIGVHDTGGDPGFNGRSSDILVNPGVASTFNVSAPTPVRAGNPFTFTVTAMDAYGNVATGYSGTVQFGSSDTNSCKLLPANSSLSNGTGTFTAKLISTGAQTVTATDTVSSSITGNAMINVTSGTVHFIVSPSATAVAVGQPISITVTAVDVCDNPQPSYTSPPSSPVHFTSTDGSATLPADFAFTGGDNGTHTFTNGVSLFSAGQQTVTATDTFNQFFGTSPAIDVTAGATTISLAPLPQQLIFRKSITLTATVHVTAPATGTPTGTVTFYDGAVPLCSPVALSGTQATFTSNQWKIGRHSFTAVYQSDSANYTDSPFSAQVVLYKSPKPK